MAISGLNRIFKILNQQQPQMLKRLSDLFVTALTSSDLLIHHHGLAAFTKFAEETMHESVVPECINSQPQLQDFVVQFINKVVTF